MRPPFDPQADYLEDQLQMGLVEWLGFLENRVHLTFSHVPNQILRAGKKGRGKPDGRFFKLLKMGMKPGHPDLDIFVGNPPRMLLIEIKTMTGPVRPSQEKRADLLRRLGFDHRILVAESPQHLITQVAKILREEYGIVEAQ